MAAEKTKTANLKHPNAIRAVLEIRSNKLRKCGHRPAEWDSAQRAEVFCMFGALYLGAFQLLGMNPRGIGLMKGPKLCPDRRAWGQRKTLLQQQKRERERERELDASLQVIVPSQEWQGFPVWTFAGEFIE